MTDYQQIRDDLDTRNTVAYLTCASDLLIAKWQARAGIKSFRMLPWLPKARVREAHLQLEMDIVVSLDELRRGS